jgi:hypothetical protein
VKFIHTLYIDTTKAPFRDTFGWAAPEYHLMGWVLSCLQVHKYYGIITLYANSPAAHLLVDTLQLPYTDVHLVLDQLSLIHPELWALPKIYTYSLQEQPFLHIDGDVFIFKQFDPGLLTGELIAQNVEVATEHFYMPPQRELMLNFTYFPPCVRKDFENIIPFQACNAGILGGNNISFFHEYTDWAFEYIYKNVDHLNHVNVNKFNIFFEQHLFYAMAKEKDIHVNVLLNEIIEDNGYRNMGNFHEIPFNRSYLHLLGHFKRDEYTCIQMAAKLRELYPEYYERIVALFHDKKIRLSPSGFKNGTNQINEQTNTHLQRLKLAAINCPSDIDETLFQSDFETFFRQLTSFLPISNNIEYLFERDAAAQLWYRNLFADMSGILNKTIVCCPKTKIIKSAIDWAGLFNKYYRVGVGYYSDLKITKGSYNNLVVPEASDNGFSLYDINEIDNTLLLLLSEPLSVNEILVKMQIYFDNDVLQIHYEIYQNFIFNAIKELTLKKAIHPL